MHESVIVSATRLPTGKFLGSLSSLPATDLGGRVIREAVARAGIETNVIDECIMGNVVSAGLGQAPARHDQPQLPGYAWPSYAPHPNYGSVAYPKQYSPSAWPYIGPFYPYPQVPLGWRKVVLEWDDGWWMLDFKSK